MCLYSIRQAGISTHTIYSLHGCRHELIRCAVCGLSLWVSPLWVKPQSSVCFLAQHNCLASAYMCLCLAVEEDGQVEGEKQAPEH